MREVQFIAPTKRRNMTQARATKIFLSRNGRCHRCKLQIRTGESWFIEHPEAVNLGGSDDDAELWPAHTERCKREKDAEDRRKISRRNRSITKRWAGKRKKRWACGRDTPFKKKLTGEVVRR